MATEDVNEGCSNEKLDGNASTQTAGVFFTNIFKSETECGLSTISISASDDTECTTPNHKQSKSELSQILSNMVIEKWDSVLSPTPKMTVESILGEDSGESSIGEAEKEVTHKSSSHVEDVEVQNHNTRNTAPTNSKKKKHKKPAKRQQYYRCAMPDTRILSSGAIAIAAASMVGEYDELWKEIQTLILSEYTRLGL